VFSILPKENWTYTVRNAKIFLTAGIYPTLSSCLLSELDPETAAECALDYIMAQNGAEPDNFQDWLVWNFGKSIADYYMIPYNSKIWAYPLEKMETGWMRGKMPMPEKKELLVSLLMKDPTERKMPHSTFYYPTEGGIQTMVDAIAAPLDLRCGNPVKSIEQRDARWYVNGEGTYEAVISTLPLPVLNNVMKLPGAVEKAIGGLKYNSLNTVLFGCPPTDISWLYILAKNTGRTVLVIKAP
jgi:protoporphyrinogen oxidase